MKNIKKETQPSADEKNIPHEMITLNPYMIEKLGLIRNRSMIQTDDYKLACVPCMLSMDSCKVLLILSPREQNIVNQGSPNLMFHLEFHVPDYSKPVPLFIRIQMTNFQILNKNKNQCLLTAAYLKTPHIYENILLNYFNQTSRYKELYENAQQNARSFNHREIARSKVNKAASIRWESDEKTPVRIIDISLKKATLFLDMEKEELDRMDDSFMLEIQKDTTPFILNARKIDFCASREVEGCQILRADLQFNTSLADCLAPLILDRKETQEEEPREPVTAPSEQENEEKTT